MHPNAVEAIAKSLIQLANDKKSAPFLNQEIVTTYKQGQDGNVIEYLSTLKWYDDRRKVVETLLRKYKWGERFSERYVQREIDAIIARLVTSEAQLLSAVDELSVLVHKIETFDAEYITLIPIVGLDLEYDALAIGQVRIVRVTSEMIEQWLEQFSSSLDKGDGTEEQKCDFISVVRSELEDLKGKVCIEHRAIAEPERANEMADSEAHRVLDLLIYAGGAQAGGRSGRTAVGLQGEVGGGIRPTLTFHAESGAILSSSALVGRSFPLVLSPRHRDKLEKLGFFDIAEVLASVPEDDSLDDSILRGLHWFSSGITQSEPENALLNLVTCLEAFLGAGPTEPIQNSVAEGLAFVLGETKKQRVLLKRRVKEFYAMRSRLSHGGRKAVAEADLVELIRIAGTLIIKVIQRRKELATRQELLRWVEDKRMS